MDEMDLVGQLKEVPPLRPEAYERARTMLGTAMAQTGTMRVAAPARKEKPGWVRNFRLGLMGKVGIGAVGAAAVAAVVVSVGTSGVSPAPSSGTTAEAPPVGSKLVSLAADVKATDGTLPGDASLVIRNRTAPDGKPYITYNLYTDKGAEYVSETKAELSAAVAHDDNLADPVDAKEIAAARDAAKGDLNKARQDMVNAVPNGWGLGLGPAEAQAAWDKSEAERVRILKMKGVADAQPRPRPTGKGMDGYINNSLWVNSLNALTRGAANAQVRAGVLRLISTIPDVTVEETTSDGQAALALTAGPAIFGGTGGQVLTINAKTGLPISSVAKPGPGEKPMPADTYKSARVTVADIKAGKF
ncbi:hypothetical protein [Actinocrispum sp. NPDC049592]|uniref:hypothetical protein n=1 Tax=Actinocrispum sp. NPDC049592 TaxID=3154835 RepID=UPI0034175640